MILDEDIASSSDADLDEQINQLMTFSDIPMLLSSGDDEPPNSLWSMSSTIDWAYTRFVIFYTDENGLSRSYSMVPQDYTSRAGNNYGRVLTSLSDIDFENCEFKYAALQLYKNALPPSGKYQLLFAESGVDIYIPQSKVILYSRKYIDNANFQDSMSDVSFTDNGNGFVTDYINLDLGNIGYLEFRLYPESGSAYSWSSLFAVEFTKLGSDATVDITTAGGSYSSADATTDTAQNTSQIVQNTSEMNDTLKEIVQTISNQLEALWDQMYNLMHVPQLANDNKNTDRIVNKQQEQIENDNANTEAVTGAIERHGNFIIEGLKSLFIPSDEYFKSWFDGMYAFFNDRLGFFMLPVDVLIEFIDIFSASSEEFAGIPFPEFKWVDGTVVIPAQTVKFDFLETDWGKDIQTKMYFVGNVIMIGSLFHLIQQKLKEVTER